ncbi:RlpA-like lipoprotein [Alteripontixanthobacter maritimus]|uniref:Endolytic peptidoglycan transglycosylase RlpA n=1 Tax=Alteripontixanthobacter maritimus TaxID=2161824 RepID=A0A369Q5R9_9SPHN|nr:septal ring lytic transglycosylase RlpA family protein [Alteripontixanthobacter maritimus]RDC60233.1 RlpA-like lipoprotein [Alteripontixanthobacter maritimus]
MENIRTPFVAAIAAARPRKRHSFAFLAAAIALPAIANAPALAETGTSVPVVQPLPEQSDFTAEFRAIPNPTRNFKTPPGAVDITAIEPPIEVEAPTPSPSATMSGHASYYGRKFHGRRTANGERFDMNAMTAAHKTLPFGTKVRVINPANGKEVTVRINDRGPFIRGRTIDLSKAAAKKIGIISRGHGSVEMDILD